jgi:hypothetical protein
MSVKPAVKRLFGRKPQKNLRRLERFAQRGEDLGYLGGNSAIHQEIELRKKLLKMQPNERKDHIKWRGIRTGKIGAEGKVNYGANDEALRVTRNIIKRHLGRNPNAILEKYQLELEELREKGSLRHLKPDEIVRLRELITKATREEERLKKARKTAKA